VPASTAAARERNTRSEKCEAARGGPRAALPQQDRVSLVRREEAGVDARDAEQRDMRAVAQRDGRVAARRRGGSRDGAGAVRRAVQGDPVARGLTETEDAVVARRGRSVVPRRLVASGKADQRLTAARCALDRIAGRPPDGFVAATADDRLVAQARIDELGAAAADDCVAGAAASSHCRWCQRSYRQRHPRSSRCRRCRR
jgi:hypothetical protein